MKPSILDRGLFCLEMNEAIFRFIENQWGPIDPLGEAGLRMEEWQRLAEKAFQKKINSLESIVPLKHCIRLVGQSGAGKTSQLLPAVNFALQMNKKTFVSLAVRDFVEFHPRLNEIKERFGESLLREKTNAFALTLLTLVFQRCVESHLPILFEVTLLSPLYEEFIHQLLLKEGYGCDYLCLAVSKTVSDGWIQARFLESQRIVSKSSSDFFFNTLHPAMESIRTYSLKNRVFIWGRNSREPIVTSLGDSSFLDMFLAEQNVCEGGLSLEEGLDTKKSFLCQFYQENGVCV